MKIKYKNYIIEDDRNCVQLYEIKTKKDWNNIGEEFESDKIYPINIGLALENILEKERRSKEDTLDLEWYIKEIKEINKEMKSFIEDNKIKF